MRCCFRPSSFSDHYQRWAAGPNRPGINYLDPEQYAATAARLSATQWLTHTTLMQVYGRRHPEAQGQYRRTAGRHSEERHATQSHRSCVRWRNERPYMQLCRTGEDLDVVVLSYHWGSNYSWRPPKEFQRLAHRYNTQPSRMSARAMQRTSLTRYRSDRCLCSKGDRRVRRDAHPRALGSPRSGPFTDHLKRARSSLCSQSSCDCRA
jgi:hypothetical protein